MATFAKAAYNASAYGAFRPTYPKKLYDIVLAYHRAGRGRCVDLGCGTGVSAFGFLHIRIFVAYGTILARHMLI